MLGRTDILEFIVFIILASTSQSRIRIDFIMSSVLWRASGLSACCYQEEGERDYIERLKERVTR